MPHVSKHLKKQKSIITASYYARTKKKVCLIMQPKKLILLPF